MKSYIMLALWLLWSTFSAAQVSGSFFGMDNHVVSNWPSVSLGTLRLWDNGTAWANLNPHDPASYPSYSATDPNNPAYTWSNLDSWLSAAYTHNVQVIYTLGHTPQWAANGSSSTCQSTIYACMPPKSNTSFSNFVTALLKHNIAFRNAHNGGGGIKFIEIWNEPNDKGFYQGTVSQLAAMHIKAYNAVQATDSTVKVLTPAPTYASNPQLGLTSPATWMGTYYLPALKSQGGGSMFYGVDYHAYFGPADGKCLPPNPEKAITWATNMRNAVTGQGYSASIPLTVSEGSWGDGTTCYVSAMSNNQKVAFLARWYLNAISHTVSKAVWYGWDFSPWGTLWSSSAGVSPAGTAYGQLYKWLNGATFSMYCSNSTAVTGQSSTAIYVCKVTRANGYVAAIAWTTNSSATFTFTSGLYKDARHLDGTKTFLSGGSASIEQRPILFENFAVF